jgi:hypothetical protein
VLPGFQERTGASLHTLSRIAVAEPASGTEVNAAIARAQLDCFDRHYSTFRALNASTKEHFDRGDGPATQTAVRDRSRSYDQRVTEKLAHVERAFAASTLAPLTGREVKLQYIDLRVDPGCGLSARGTPGLVGSAQPLVDVAVAVATRYGTHGQSHHQSDEASRAVGTRC